MEALTDVRLDKWLWAVRLYKSRSLAAAACQGGKVRVNGQSAKPARALRPGDVIVATIGELTRTVKVIALLKSRIGSKRVPEYMDDLTPAAELAKPRAARFAPVGLRPKGSGRPTKRDRRILDSFFE